MLIEVNDEAKEFPTKFGTIAKIKVKMKRNKSKDE
jgi:hypothetical protein